MIYALHDLLIKMGAPEVAERGRIAWHSFNDDGMSLKGSAHIQLDAGGERLTAELRNIRENYEDDDGRYHPVYEESFHLTAVRTARPDHYRVVAVALDGEVYERPQKSIIELGLSVFHARALEISILMVEQAFNKEDIFNAAESTRRLEKLFVAKAAPKKQESWGVVVPFRPRSKARAPALA